MLQLIRSKAASLVVKVLFALLIVTFGVWGIGDVLRNRAVEMNVATVGAQKISAQELNQAVRGEIQRLRGVFGGAFDIEQAKQLGIIDQQLDSLISNALISQEIQHLKLAAGDETVRAIILSNQAFKNSSGQFDRTRYQQLLAANRMSEAQYEASLRAELNRNELVEAMSAGGTAPAPLVDTLYRIRAEKRVADTVFIPFSSAGNIGEPSEADLAEFHQKHGDLFRAPELRSFTVAFLKLDDLAQSIQVSDNETMDEYQSRLPEFQTPERRHLEQILVPDDDTAQKVLAALKGGRSFSAVAKDVAKLPNGPTDLGTVTEQELPPELAAAAFKLPANGVSDAVKSPFGTHILHVVAIEPPKTLSYEEVRPKLTAELARDRADRQMGSLINKVDDALAGGGDLDKVAADLGLKIVKISDIDQTGHAVAGGVIVLPSPASDILASAFATDQGQIGGVTDTTDGGFYVVRVDKVTPAALRPLSSVRDAVRAAWQQEQRIQRADKIAKEILDAVNGGATLKDVAAKRNLKLTTTPQLGRSGEDGGLPAPLVGKLFELKVHQAATADSADGAYVAELTQLIAASPTVGKSELDQMSRQLGGAIQSDLLTQYQYALRKRFPVAIDQSALDRAF